ncbi:MAG TPA: LysE family transporter [Syntrophales bacterium]|nr:LysE family transporter [Syntrophales bacterium]
MWELVGIFVSSFIIAFSGAMMPGPLLTATISESSQRGVSAGPLLIVGHAILEVILLVALMLGLAPFLQRNDVFATVAIAGGIILLWLAFEMFRSLPGLTMSVSRGTTRSGSLVMSGAILSIANPYWIVWWATIGFGYVIYSSKLGISGLVFFFTGHILADFIWYGTVSLAVGKGSHLFTDGFYRWVVGTCAVVLLLFACYFFYAGVEKIIV